MANCKKLAFDSIGKFGDLANHAEGLEKENPAASGKANGVGQLGKSFKSITYRKRAEAATSLCLAIAECDRDDAVTLMEAALWDLRAGAPGVIFAAVMEEAEDWADFATWAERKAYLLACYKRLPGTDQAAFLAHVTGGQHG